MINLDRAKLEVFVGEKLNVTVMMISLLHGVENSVGKGENAGYQHFLLFPLYFPKPSSRVVKSWDCVVKSKRGRGETGVYHHIRLSSFNIRLHILCCLILVNVTKDL